MVAIQSLAKNAWHLCLATGSVSLSPSLLFCLKCSSLTACAILFPHIVLFVIVFPLPIRVAAAVFVFMYFLLIVTRSNNAGGEAAHLAGMAAGAAYVVLMPKVGRWRMKMRAGSWEKSLEQQRKLQIEVDRILAKVHREGLHSLTGKEKKTLKQATQMELRRQKA